MLLARQQPGRAGDQLHSARGPSSSARVVRRRDAVAPRSATRGCRCWPSSARGTSTPSLGRASSTSSSRLWIALCDVAATPTRLPRRAGRHDQPRAGVRLAGAGRALDEQRRAVERRDLRREPSTSIGPSVSGGVAGASRGGGAASRSAPASSSPRLDRRAPARRAARSASCCSSVRYGLPGISARGSGVVGRLAALDPEHAALGLVDARDRHLCLGRWVDASPRPSLCCCGGKRSGTQRTAVLAERDIVDRRRGPPIASASSSRSSAGVFEPVEVRPPRRLLLAAVVVEQVGDHGARAASASRATRRRASPRSRSRAASSAVSRARAAASLASRAGRERGRARRRTAASASRCRPAASRAARSVERQSSALYSAIASSSRVVAALEPLLVGEDRAAAPRSLGVALERIEASTALSE